ncbi:MAG: amidohydrolase family protein [Phycisphaerales bacterium]|nr:amidohydrolase family protein [Phycisphaerales bacterium]
MGSAVSTYNRLGLDYRKEAEKLSTRVIIDVHTHTREPRQTAVMVEAAKAYGIQTFYTMCPLEHAPAIQESFPGLFHFIAVPAWQNAAPTDEFFEDWWRRVEAFARPPLNAKMVKFHAAPGTRKRWGTSLDHPRVRELARRAYELGYHFMTHVGDPKAWFFRGGGGGRYADGYGTFESQFEQLEWMLEKYPDRLHMGAHFGGSLEDLEALAKRLEKYPHYVVDSSATKWIVRAVTEQSTQAVKDFLVTFQDRVLFGSDLVVGEQYSWDHYASRYWAHRTMWETDYRGESPIEDPDAGKGFLPKAGEFDTAKADGVPRLVGLELPEEVLGKLYGGNAQRWLPR